MRVSTGTIQRLKYLSAYRKNVTITPGNYIRCTSAAGDAYLAIRTDENFPSNMPFDNILEMVNIASALGEKADWTINDGYATIENTELLVTAKLVFSHPTAAPVLTKTVAVFENGFENTFMPGDWSAMMRTIRQINGSDQVRVVIKDGTVSLSAMALSGSSVTYPIMVKEGDNTACTFVVPQVYLEIAPWVENVKVEVFVNPNGSTRSYFKITGVNGNNVETFVMMTTLEEV